MFIVQVLDMEIVCPGGKTMCNMAVMASHSPLLRNVLEEGSRDSVHIFPEANINTVKEVLRRLHGGHGEEKVSHEEESILSSLGTLNSSQYIPSEKEEEKM